jgi:hypothetical protein
MLRNIYHISEIICKVLDEICKKRGFEVDFFKWMSVSAGLTHPAKQGRHLEPLFLFCPGGQKNPAKKRR